MSIVCTLLMFDHIACFVILCHMAEFVYDALSLTI